MPSPKYSLKYWLLSTSPKWSIVHCMREQEIYIKWSQTVWCRISSCCKLHYAFACDSDRGFGCGCGLDLIALLWLWLLLVPLLLLRRRIIGSHLLRIRVTRRYHQYPLQMKKLLVIIIISSSPSWSRHEAFRIQSFNITMLYARHTNPYHQSCRTRYIQTSTILYFHYFCWIIGAFWDNVTGLCKPYPYNQSLHWDWRRCVHLIFGRNCILIGFDLKKNENLEYILGKTVLKRELTKKGKECDVNGLWGMHPELPLKLSAMQRLNVQCVYDGKHIRATYTFNIMIWALSLRWQTLYSSILSTLSLI